MKTNLSEIKRKSFEHFPTVKVGRYTLSIQGSSGHYCSPRLTLPYLRDYSSVEVRIYNADSKPLQLLKSSVFRKFIQDEDCSHNVSGNAEQVILAWFGTDKLETLITLLESKK